MASGVRDFFLSLLFIFFGWLSANTVEYVTTINPIRWLSGKMKAQPKVEGGKATTEDG